MAAGRRLSQEARRRDLPTANRSGHLVYTNKEMLFAVPFDLDRLEVRGKAAPVLDDVAHQALSGGAQFDVSRSGTLVYRKAGGSTAQAMARIQGLTPSTGGPGKKEPLRSKPGIYISPRLSPDGTRLAMMVTEPGGNGLVGLRSAARRDDAADVRWNTRQSGLEPGQPLRLLRYCPERHPLDSSRRLQRPAAAHWNSDEPGAVVDHIRR